MAAQENHVLQLSLFETPDNRQSNYTALFDLAPRYLPRTERKKETAFLDGVYREFTFDGEQYALSITPARIRDPITGVEKDKLPGEREQLVEDVIRKLASESLQLGQQDEVITNFTVHAIYLELKKHRHTFNKAEIKEALQVLHRSVIEITKVTKKGERKQKAIVSASVFPALYMRDVDDPTSKAQVQLNPFLAQAIKSLAFEQVDYEWMMQIKGQMTRWLFKSVSLMFAGTPNMPEVMEIKASDIAKNHGTEWSRWRDALAHVQRSVTQLKDVNVCDDILSKDVMEGSKKTDVIYTLRFSQKFLRDRRMAKAKHDFVTKKAEAATGGAKLERWHQITAEAAAGIRMDQRKELSTLSH
ncbi:hypothetical protein HFN89_03270 [Rhizobium laguerreae]|nr:hypothetical protein [Rhizobium laguerreae]